MPEITAVKEELKEAIIKGKRDVVEPLIRKGLSQGLSPEEIMDEMMIPAMDVVGDRFSRNEIFLPEMMIAARAMNTGLDILRPMLIAKGVSSRGRVVIGTVKGDIHDVGKNIVSMVLQGAGYEVVDLGIDVPPEKFVDVVKQHQPKFLLTVRPFDVDHVDDGGDHKGSQTSRVKRGSESGCGRSASYRELC